MIESFKLPNITPETLTGSIVSFTDEYGGLPLKSCVSQISGYQEGSGTPSPDNVRPLHAWSGANLTACGTNLWDEEWEVGSYNETTGAKTISVYTTIRNKNPIIIKGGLSYYLSTPSVIRILQYRRDGSYINAISLPDSHIYSPSDEVGYINFRTITAYGTVYNNDISINYPSTDTDYHAYNGNTYTFTFGQTIYQGCIDWKRGVVTGIKVYRTFDGSEDWRVSSTGNNYYLEIGINSMVADTIECDKFENIHRTPTIDFIGITNTGRYIQIRPSTASLDVPTWKTWLQQNGLQVAYELAAPIEIPLGGINLLTQEGVNNIFCDTGDTEVKRLKVN